MNCPHCATALSDDARFCPACGKQTISTESSAGNLPAVERDLVGREIAGRYRVLKKLGEGGMGAVYRGEQISLKRAVAVKVLRPELSANQMILRRFNAEAEAVAKLNHPNTVGIYDFGQDTDGSLFIAMEYIEGRSLRSAIHAEAPMHPARALAIASQVAAALADAHAHSIVHRDLKPDNVMLQDRGRQKDVVRVLDFGIAKLRDDSRQTQNAMTQAGDMLGTPQYMAPEQIKGEHIDGRTDIYALGCMIYEMITARLPFEATTVMAMLSKHLMEGVIAPSQRRPELALSPEIDRLVLTAMMKEPAARPPTMELYGEHIAHVLAMLPPDPNRSTGAPMSAAQPIPAPPMVTPMASVYAPPVAPAMTPPPAMVAPASHKKSRAPLYVVLGLLAIGGIGAGAYYAGQSHDTTHPEPEPEPEPVPTPPPTPTPTKADPWDAVKETHIPHPPPTDTISGTIHSAGQGVRVNFPHGYNVQANGVGVGGGNGNWAITAGPIVTSASTPADAAMEYARMTGLAYDGITTRTFAGQERVMARFHGMINGMAIDQQVVAYTGPSYNVAVGLAVPYAQRNSAAVQRFASELFDKRVLLP